jgi:predicted dienelactone hydrolase
MILAVGYRQVVVTDAQLGLSFSVHVLYPTTARAQRVAVGRYQLDMAPEAPAASGSFPLVLVSHGTGSSGLLHRQLAQALVGQGYVVGLLEHPHNNHDDDSWANTPQNLMARPSHLHLTLDTLLRDPHLGPALDPTAAALIGHSLGGYAVLAATGGQPEEVNPTSTRGLAIPVPPADARVRALVLLAPALPWYAAPGALHAVQTPLLVLAAEQDEYLPPVHSEQVLRGVPATTPVTWRVVPNAGHFSFLTPFPAYRTRPDFPPSQDPPGFDRPQFQVELAREVARFLAQYLPPGRGAAGPANAG